MKEDDLKKHRMRKQGDPDHDAKRRAAKRERGPGPAARSPPVAFTEEDHRDELRTLLTEEDHRNKLRTLAAECDAYANMLEAGDLKDRVLAVAEAAKKGSGGPAEALREIVRHVKAPLSDEELDAMNDALEADRDNSLTQTR
jgi:hypothetical protein